MEPSKRKFSKLSRTKHPAVAPIIEPKPEKRVHLSPDLKGANLKLSQDMQAITGHKGYRSILANYPIIEGTYFFEAKLEKSSVPPQFVGTDPQVRIGVATIKSDYEMSLGSDRYSYSLKSIDGSIMHDGMKTGFNENYGEGDTIGCLIHMKPPKPRVKGEGVHKEKVEINEGSKLIFYKNGNRLAVGYNNLHEGFYHAGISLYMNSKVRVNFGPEFEKPPDVELLDEEIRDYKPYCVIANEPKPYEDLESP